MVAFISDLNVDLAGTDKHVRSPSVVRLNEPKQVLDPKATDGDSGESRGGRGSRLPN